MNHIVEKKSEKKFVRYKEGAEMYSISQSLFERLLEPVTRLEEQLLWIVRSLKGIWKVIKCHLNVEKC